MGFGWKGDAVIGARHRRATIRLTVCLAALLWVPASPAATRPAPAFPRAAVALPDPTAAAVALDILRAGGNAVDAAVAASFALAVTYPQAGNLGGGGFMLIRLSTGRTLVVDYRETAPAAARRDMYLDSSGRPVPALSRESWLAVGVPGTVAGMTAALEAAGTMPLDRLLAPAIALAEEGFPVPEGLAQGISRFRDRLAAHPAAAGIFLPGGKAPQAGQVLVQRDLARTLRLVAAGGSDAFYKGSVARDLEEAMERNGGILTAADMEGYRAVLREPVRTRYREFEVLSVPPPSAGGVVLAQMLHMLETRSLNQPGWGSSAYIHLLAEVMKRAYADRATFLGDPAHVDVPLEELLSRDYARMKMDGFDPSRATPAAEAGPGDPFGHESESTTHFSIADEHGNVVAATTTLNGSFGIGAVLEGWGFLLNNEMDDFSAAPGSPNMYGLVGTEANAVAPGKRMLSSMTPTILTRDGKPYMALGSPGGGRITTMVLQVILNVVEFDMDLQAAVDAPRCHHQWKPDRISCEKEALSADVEEGLRGRGHEVETGPQRGDIQALLFDDETGRIHAASDARGYGAALGY